VSLVSSTKITFVDGQALSVGTQLGDLAGVRRGR
jgi:hypothetical protein